MFDHRHLSARTKTTEQLITESLFADNCVLIAHKESDLQSIVDKFAESSRLVDFTMSLGNNLLKVLKGLIGSLSKVTYRQMGILCLGEKLCPFYNNFEPRRRQVPIFASFQNNVIYILFILAYKGTSNLFFRCFEQLKINFEVVWYLMLIFVHNS